MNCAAHLGSQSRRAHPTVREPGQNDVVNALCVEGADRIPYDGLTLCAPPIATRTKGGAAGNESDFRDRMRKLPAWKRETASEAVKKDDRGAFTDDGIERKYVGRSPSLET